jgi:hypothetical protein
MYAKDLAFLTCSNQSLRVLAANEPATRRSQTQATQIGRVEAVVWPLRGPRLLQSLFRAPSGAGGDLV